MTTDHATHPRQDTGRPYEPAACMTCLNEARTLNGKETYVYRDGHLSEVYRNGVLELVVRDGKVVAFHKDGVFHTVTVSPAPVA